MSGVIDIIKPKRPVAVGWRLVARPALASDYPNEAWAHDGSGIGVITAVEVVQDAAVPGPEYHLSVSAFGQRCSAADALWACAQFDLLDAEEDNHVPSGRVRNFWRPVADRLAGIECPCKEVEPVIREDKGDYIWRAASRDFRA